jgi:hypothetical protein
MQADRVKRGGSPVERSGSSPFCPKSGQHQLKKDKFSGVAAFRRGLKK